MDDHEHFGPDCPTCQAFSEQAKILGGFAEATQQLIDNGTFERMGREMAERREKAILDAFLKS